MFFELFAQLWVMAFMGINHTVEILQSYVFFYIILSSCLLFVLHWTHDLKRFFFFSELAWLCVLALLLSLSTYSNNNSLFANSLFVLVFTACEAVTLACLLLVSFESRKKVNKV